MYDYRDTITSATFLGFTKYKVKVANIQFQVPYWNGIPYFAIIFEFHVNPEGWDVDFLDTGFYELINNQRVAIRSGDPPTRVVTPARLDGAGRKLAEGAADKFYPDPKKNLYKPKNFGVFNLPATIGGQ